jgi:hypothetical protein
MVSLRQQRYIPVVRTRDAEMKGFSNLSNQVLDGIVPLVEITKSRRSTNNPDGAIKKNVDRMLDVLDGRPFVVDLCAIESFQNREFDNLLDASGAFTNWTSYVRRQLPPNCIPVVHLTEPHIEGDFLTQARAVVASGGYVAIRVPTSYSYVRSLVTSVAAMVREGFKIILIVDASFVPPWQREAAFLSCKGIVDSFTTLPTVTVPLSSSFPSSVVDKRYGGGDANGKFDLSEVFISEKLKTFASEPTLWHGDYSLTYPLAVEGIVTNWVPRVDIPLNDSLYYYRYRRGDGGYVRAAAEAINDSSFARLKCWGEDNVREAAAGTPQGMSPAHWIAVRMNMHITRQFTRLKKSEK